MDGALLWAKDDAEQDRWWPSYNCLAAGQCTKQVGHFITFGQYCMLGFWDERKEREADRWPIHQDRLYFLCFLNVFGAIRTENICFSTLKQNSLEQIGFTP